MGKGKKIIAGCLIGAIVIGGGVGAYLKFGKKPTPVNVYPFDYIGMSDYWGDRSTTEGTISTENMQSVYVSSTQKITQIYVREGQNVQKGEPLVAFDTTLSEIELERQRITLEKTKNDLTKENENLARINNMIPYYPPAPVPEPDPVVLEPMELPLLLKGKGTEEEPYVFLWNDACWYSDEFIRSLERPMIEIPAPEPEEGEEPGEPTFELSDTIFVAFAKRQYDNPAGELERCWGMVFKFDEENNYVFSVIEVSPDTVQTEEEEEKEPEITPIDYSSGYTASEIAQMRSESQQRIKDLTTQVKVEEIKYKRMQLELNSGIVTAELDGVVKNLVSEQEAAGGYTPLLTVSAGGGYAVTGTVGEFDLASLRVGQTVQVMSYMTGTVAEGQIVEIGDQPTDRGWSNGNNNVSFYPFKVYLSDDAGFQEYDYVEITYGTSGASSSVYLEMPFVLTENGSSCVYVRGEDGTLEKREVVTGKNLYNSYVEIKSGVTAEDYVAFPYGKEVKAGAPTVEAGWEELYGGSSYGW